MIIVSNGGPETAVCGYAPAGAIAWQEPPSFLPVALRLSFSASSSWLSLYRPVFQQHPFSLLRLMHLSCRRHRRRLIRLSHSVLFLWRSRRQRNYLSHWRRKPVPAPQLRLRQQATQCPALQATASSSLFPYRTSFDIGKLFTE